MDKIQWEFSKTSRVVIEGNASKINEHTIVIGCDGKQTLQYCLAVNCTFGNNFEGILLAAQNVTDFFFSSIY